MLINASCVIRLVKIAYELLLLVWSILVCFDYFVQPMNGNLELRCMFKD